MNQTVAPQVLRLPAVMQMTGLGKTSIYARIADGLFPKSIPVGSRAVVWPIVEVEAINRAYIAGKTNDEVKALVRKLEAKRKELDE